MFGVRKKLMTYQEIEPRPLAALQALCQLSCKAEWLLPTPVTAGGGEREGQETSVSLHARESGQCFLTKWESCALLSL